MREQVLRGDDVLDPEHGVLTERVALTKDVLGGSSDGGKARKGKAVTEQLRQAEARVETSDVKY